MKPQITQQGAIAILRDLLEQEKAKPWPEGNPMIVELEKAIKRREKRAEVRT